MSLSIYIYIVFNFWAEMDFGLIANFKLSWLENAKRRATKSLYFSKRTLSSKTISIYRYIGSRLDFVYFEIYVPS